MSGWSIEDRRPRLTEANGRLFVERGRIGSIVQENVCGMLSRSEDAKWKAERTIIKNVSTLHAGRARYAIGRLNGEKGKAKNLTRPWRGRYGLYLSFFAECLPAPRTLASPRRHLSGLTPFPLVSRLVGPKGDWKLTCTITFFSSRLTQTEGTRAPEL